MYVSICFLRCFISFVTGRRSLKRYYVFVFGAFVGILEIENTVYHRTALPYDMKSERSDRSRELYLALWASKQNSNDQINTVKRRGKLKISTRSTQKGIHAISRKIYYKIINAYNAFLLGEIFRWIKMCKKNKQRSSDKN